MQLVIFSPLIESETLNIFPFIFWKKNICLNFERKQFVKFIISSDVTFNVFIDNGNSVVKISKSYALSVNNDIKMDCITSMDWE